MARKQFGAGTVFRPNSRLMMKTREEIYSGV
jgi:hypothetical protein